MCSEESWIEKTGYGARKLVEGGWTCIEKRIIIYIIKERLETDSGMESYLPNSDRHAASWIFSDGPTKPTGVVKLRYNALELFFDNVAI